MRIPSWTKEALPGSPVPGDRVHTTTLAGGDQPLTYGPETAMACGLVKPWAIETLGRLPGVQRGSVLDCPGPAASHMWLGPLRNLIASCKGKWLPWLPYWTIHAACVTVRAHTHTHTAHVLCPLCTSALPHPDPRLASGSLEAPRKTLGRSRIYFWPFAGPQGLFQLQPPSLGTHPNMWRAWHRTGGQRSWVGSKAFRS